MDMRNIFKVSTVRSVMMIDISLALAPAAQQSAWAVLAHARCCVHCCRVFALCCWVYARIVYDEGQ